MQTVKIDAKPWNPNGNGGRSYFYCENCQKFHSWADEQGVHPNNPPCYCSKPTRLGRSSLEKGNEPYLSCATKECRYFKKLAGTETQAMVNPITELAGMSLEAKDKDVKDIVQ